MFFMWDDSKSSPTAAALRFSLPLLALVVLLSPRADALSSEHSVTRSARQREGHIAATKVEPLSEQTLGKVHDFDAFLEVHGKAYPVDSEEYKTRRQLFYERVAKVEEHNARPHRLWDATVNRFADQTDSELAALRGWRHLGASTRAEIPVASSLLETGEAQEADQYPDNLNWKNLSMTQNVYDQGSCGSCWAVATVSVLEAHYEIQHGKSRSFSVQELVNCVSNPKHCGGKGGCDGATVELGMNWAVRKGLTTNEDVAYEARDGECQKPREKDQGFATAVLDADGIMTFPELAKPQQVLAKTKASGGHAFGLHGFSTLEKNRELPLVKALVEQGPVAVSVAAETWFSYHSGVFNGCPKDAIVDHAVTLFGYGKTQAHGHNRPGHKYWLIRNSWGSEWGEGGFIRLVRHNNEEEWCGTDDKPSMGVSCDGAPSKVRVCGSCGILYDSVVPHFAPSLAVQAAVQETGSEEAPHNSSAASLAQLKVQALEVEASAALNAAPASSRLVRRATSGK